MCEIFGHFAQRRASGRVGERKKGPGWSEGAEGAEGVSETKGAKAAPAVRLDHTPPD